MLKIIKWLLIIFVLSIIGLIVLGYEIDAHKSPEQKAAEADATAESQRVAAVRKQEQAAAEIASLRNFSANDLAMAYNNNSVAADLQFKGQKFKVTGVVVDINTDIFGNPYVTLRGGVNQFMEPQFAFERDQTGVIAQFRKGMKVTLVCIGKGDVAKTPMSGDCVPV